MGFTIRVGALAAPNAKTKRDALIALNETLLTTLANEKRSVKQNSRNQASSIGGGL